MVRIVVDWLVLTLAVGLVAWFMPGVHIETVSAWLWAGTGLGLANLLLRPLLNLLSLPLRLLTLGLFSVVVNGIVFFVVAALVPGFSVAKDLTTAPLAALFVTAVTWILGDLGLRRHQARLAAASSPRTGAVEGSP